MKNDTNKPKMVFILTHITRMAFSHRGYCGYDDKPDVKETEIIGVYSTKEKAVHAMQMAEMVWDNEHTYWRKFENKFRTEFPTEAEMMEHYNYCHKDDPKAKPVTLRRAFGFWYKDWQIIQKTFDAE